MSNTTKVYTLGYSGRKPEEIKKIVNDLDAILVDIRFSPRSRVPRWAKKNLIALVGGSHYHHLKAFGNENYKSGGPIKFVDFEAGQAFIEKVERPAVILMCGCKNYHTCHRAEAAQRLEEIGYEIEEIGSSGIKKTPILTQLTLF